LVFAGKPHGEEVGELIVMPQMPSSLSRRQIWLAETLSRLTPR